MWLFCQIRVILKDLEGRARGEELHKIKRGARSTRGAEQEDMRPEEQQGKIYSTEIHKMNNLRRYSRAEVYGLAKS